MKSNVSFTTNACITDIPFIKETLTHMKRSLDYPFIERIVALDVGRPIGKYEERLKGELSELRIILSNLIEEGVIDKVVEIPTDEKNKKKVLNKYFGEVEIALNDFDGAPIYQYLYAIDLCHGDYILHVDSDMLFHSGNGYSWIENAIECMKTNPQVIFTTPGGPPQAKNWLEYLIGTSLKQSNLGKWHKANFISTRYFLMDKNRFLNEMLPLEQCKRSEPLENSLTYTANKKARERWSMNEADSWAIHPVDHNENFIKYINGLIKVIEQGLYPFRRNGFKWNMYTDDKGIKPWLNLIKQMNVQKNK
jgi:hypothetical protein